MDIPGTGTQLSSAELQRMYEGDSEGLAQEEIAPRKREVRRQEPLRQLLYQQGALEPMLEALLDATAALQQRDGARDSSGGGGVAGGGAVGKVGSRRASVPKAVLQVWLSCACHQPDPGVFLWACAFCGAQGHKRTRDTEVQSARPYSKLCVNLQC